MIFGDKVVAQIEITKGPWFLAPDGKEITPPFPVGQEFQLRVEMKNKSNDAGEYWMTLIDRDIGIISDAPGAPIGAGATIIRAVNMPPIKKDMHLTCKVGHLENGNRVLDNTYTWEIPVIGPSPPTPRPPTPILLKPATIAIVALFGGILIYSLIK